MIREQRAPSVKSEYAATLGRKIVEWSQTNANDRPKNIGAVNAQLEQIGISITFPADQFDSFSPVTMISTSLNEWVVRLPPIELIEQSLKKIREGNYPVSNLPTYFRAYPHSGKRYDEEFLYVRLADFTVSQCG